MFDLDLPIHPYTGVQAIGRLKNGTPIYPVMGGAPDDGDGGDGDGAAGGDGGGSGDGGAGDGSSGNAVDQFGNDLGYPKDTSPRDMSVEQQANFYKHQQRRKDDKLKEYNGITPEEAIRLKNESEERRRNGMQPDERAIEDAVNAAKSEAVTSAAATFAPQLAEAVIERFVEDEGQRKQLLSLIDPMKFMNEGVFDKDALVTTLTGLSTAFGGNGSGNGNPSQWGQFSSRPPTQKRAEEGLAEAKRRGYIKD